MFKSFKLVFGLLFILSASNITAQTLIYSLQIGDTVVLNVSGASGSIQWQKSPDSLNWTNITAATYNPLTVITDTSYTGKRFFRAKVVDSLCPLAFQVYYSSVIRFKILTNVSQLQIGDWYRGGIIFNISSPGCGLIAPTQDQFKSTGRQWGCYGILIGSGAQSNSNGVTNTAAIIAGCSSPSIAASTCDTLTFNGYSDWFLPSIDQLNLLYQQNQKVGGFDYAWYWSSTEASLNNALAYVFGGGGGSANQRKDKLCWVRAIRAFTTLNSLSKTNFITTVANQPSTVKITSQPVSQTTCFNSSVTFTISVSGTTPITYQWKKNGIDISNATSSSYNISNVSLTDEGIYSCEVSNLCRSVLSNNASLKVDGIYINNVKPAQTNINWNKRLGKKYVVFIKQTSSGNPTPVNNTSYSANNIFGLGTQIGTSGWYSVYNDTGSAVSIKGLSPLTGYRAMILEYTGLSGNEIYSFICVAQNFSTPNYVTPTIQSSDLSFSEVKSKSFKISWKPGDGSDRVVFLKAFNSGVVSLTDNSNYYYDTVFMNGAQIGLTGWYCVYNGSKNSVVVSGLSPNTEYRAMVVDYNGISGSEKYLANTANNNPANQLTQFAIPSTQASSITYTNITTSGFRVGWTIGNGTSRAVFIKEDDTSYAEPQPNTTYTANSVFKSGMQIGGAGWYCVYNGTGNFVTVTGLALYKTYRVMVCEYNGTAGRESYNINSASSNPLNQVISDPAPTTQAMGLMFSKIYPFSAIASWTNGNGAKRAVFIKEGSSGTAVPINNTAYIADTTFGNGDQIGTTGWYCVYNGIGSSVNLKGLQYTLTYRLMVCEYNGSASKEQYNKNVAASNPANVTTQMETPAVCIVTVDTISWKNKIIWGKPKPQFPVAGFKIYKEVSTNFYSLIGSIPYSDPALFVDLASAPESHGDKYKITFYDNSNIESGKSKYHKTMNLTISKNGSTMGLRWDAYEDEGGSFIPSKYYIYRGTQPDNMQLLGSVSGSFTSYNDNNVFTPYYYLVGVIKTDGCSDYNRGGTDVMSFSNMKDNKSLVGIIDGNSNSNVSVYPNPFTQTTTISFPNKNKQTYNLRIFDLSGKTVRTIPNISDHQVIVSKADLSAGLYSFELVGDECFKGKFMVE